MIGQPVIRPLSLDEVRELLSWAKAEGWNPGIDDAVALQAADPDGFIGCFVEGRMAAGISAVCYGENYGFIGLYIAHADFRGQGLGRKIWDAGMAHLGDRVIGLDGVPEQQSNYARMGFVPAYQTARWSGIVPPRAAGSREGNAVAFDERLLPAVISYDRQFFPAPRNAFLRSWLSGPRSVTIIDDHGSVAGYAVCRACDDGFKIGPLFADTLENAKELLAACAAAAGGDVLHIDVPADQTEFADFLAEIGFARGFSTARMYRGTAPVLRSEGVYGITTLELG
jgi:GNAT superfamily N-acetyltransferase